MRKASFFALKQLLFLHNYANFVYVCNFWKWQNVISDEQLHVQIIIYKGQMKPPLILPRVEEV